MFDILPNLFASLISILLPIFASHKALRSGSPAHLAPWLMYWISFSLVTLLESHLWFVTFFVPFYAYLRIFVLLYLVLPQTQGARLIYQAHIYPFLAHHEAQIERWIGEAHEKLREYGLDRVTAVIAVIRQRVLRQAPPEEEGLAYGKAYPPPAPGSSAAAPSYASSLLARFSMPAAGTAPTGAGDFYSLLSAAAGQLGKGSTSAAGVGSLDALIKDPAGLIPSHITNPSEKAKFVYSQREKLRALIGALDREAGKLERDEGDGGMGRSKSEVSFEKIDREGVHEDRREEGGGGWLGWAMGAAKDVAKEMDKGRSSGVDR